LRSRGENCVDEDLQLTTRMILVIEQTGALQLLEHVTRYVGDGVSKPQPSGIDCAGTDREELCKIDCTCRGSINARNCGR